MTETKTLDRRFVIRAAVLIQLNLKAIYAWSVFTPALKGSGWAKLDTQLTLALGLTHQLHLDHLDDVFERALHPNQYRRDSDE